VLLLRAVTPRSLVVRRASGRPGKFRASGKF
jgi:hypothetical protein